MNFETMLTGGHPNSLGRTIEVAALVLADPAREAARMEALFACYRSADPVVRLRTSNAMKRVARERPDLVVPFVDRLIGEIGALDQPSAQWTLADLFAILAPRMTGAQRQGARAILMRNLADHGDWIVLARTMETLGAWARDDPVLRDWLGPHLDRLARDPRKAVAGKARKLHAALSRP